MLNALGQVVSVLTPKGWRQHFCGHSPTKTWDTKAQVGFLGWQSSSYSQTLLPGGVNAVRCSTKRGQLEALHWSSPELCLICLFP